MIRLDGVSTVATAHTITQAMAKTTEPSALEVLAAGLSSVMVDTLTRTTQKQIDFVALIALSPQRFGAISFLPVLNDKLRPIPCRFSTPELVEMLKHPLGVGHARHVILDRLEDRYQQRFVDQWDFVRYAEANKLGLDFHTPPRWPETPAR